VGNADVIPTRRPATCPRRDGRKPRFVARVAAALVSLLLVASTACTTVPTREFATYRTAFERAREAGEKVLLDHAASTSSSATGTEGSAPEDEPAPARSPLFDVNAAAATTTKVDHLAVRMDAWSIVQRYNDVLTGLAEGKSASAVSGAVDELTASITSFPFAEIGSTVAEFSPWLDALESVLRKAEAERSRREFLRVVTEGGPLVRTRFLTLLRADAQDFYDVELGRNNKQFSRATDRLTDVSRQLALVLKTVARSDTIDAQVARANAARRRVPVGPEERDFAPIAHSPGSGNADAVVESQISQLVDSIESAADEAVRVNERLNAYQALLAAYVKLLNQLDESLITLERAAAETRPTLPTTSELKSTVLELQKTYEAYRAKGK